MTAHVIFYFNLGAGFAFKARLVANRHKFNMSPLMMYAYVVLMDSV